MLKCNLSLGLDIGTTTISALVVDIDTGRVLASRTRKHNADIPREDPGEKLQSVGRIEELAWDLLWELLKEFPQVGSIGITGQMHGILYLDRYGTPVSPLYTWQDQRGKDLCSRLREQTGYALAPGYGLATHCALTESRSVPEDAWKICTIMDYLAYALCGREKLLMHATNGASLGLFQIEEGCFDASALEKAGIDPGILPEVTRKTEILGHYRGIPVAVAIGDNQASFLGSVADPQTTALANFGTGSQISVQLKDISQVRSGEALEIRPFLEDSCLVCGSALCGGRAYALLERFFRSFAVRCGLEDKACYDVLNALAVEGLQGSALPQVDTAFCGTREDPFKRGSITCLGEENFTPEALTAGVLLGMARELRDMFSRMPAGHITALAASGNAIRKNPALKRALENIFSMEVIIPDHQEEAAFGAALFGARAKECSYA